MMNLPLGLVVNDVQVSVYKYDLDIKQKITRH